MGVANCIWISGRFTSSRPDSLSVSTMGTDLYHLTNWVRQPRVNAAQKRIRLTRSTVQMEKLRHSGSTCLSSAHGHKMSGHRPDHLVHIIWNGIHLLFHAAFHESDERNDSRHRRGTGWRWAGGAWALCSGLSFNLFPCLMVNTQRLGISSLTQPRILLTSGILCTCLLSIPRIWDTRPRSRPVKFVTVPAPILKETSPPASHAMTFSLPSSEPASSKLLCGFKQGDEEDPTCCSKLWDERGYSEGNSQNASRKASVLGYAEALVKIQSCSHQEKLL